MIKLIKTPVNPIRFHWHVLPNRACHPLISWCHGQPLSFLAKVNINPFPTTRFTNENFIWLELETRKLSVLAVIVNVIEKLLNVIR